MDKRLIEFRADCVFIIRRASHISSGGKLSQDDIRLKRDVWLDWYNEGKVEEDVPRLAEVFKEKGVRRILDLGCGTGRHTIFFCKEGFEVSGFDWSRRAIGRARALLKEGGLRARLRVWDMTKVPYPYADSAFDAVLTIKVIQHTDLAHLRGIAREIDRITRKGGLLYVQVPTMGRAIRMKREGSLSEEVEPGTFVPLEGDEKGVLHHHFKEGELQDLFPNFEVLESKEVAEHYLLTAMKPALQAKREVRPPG